MFRSKGPERGAVWRQVDKPTETQSMCVSVCVCVSHTASCGLSTTVFLLAFVQPSVAGLFHPTPTADFPTRFNIVFPSSSSSLGGLRRGYTWLSGQLIAGSYLSIRGFGPLLKTLGGKTPELSQIQFLLCGVGLCSN